MKWFSGIFSGRSSEMVPTSENSRDLTHPGPVGQVRRLVAVMRAHGLSREQIPGFFTPDLPLRPEEIYEDDRLASRIDHNVMDVLKNRLGIQPDWLRRGTGDIYHVLSLRGHMSVFLRFLALHLKAGSSLQMYLVREVNREGLLSGVAMFFRVPIRDLHGRVVYRYYPCGDLWDWNDHNQRIELKCMIAMALKSKVVVRGAYAEADILDDLASGQDMPGNLMRFMAVYAWRPRLYVMLASEHPRPRSRTRPPAFVTIFTNVVG